MRTQARHRLAKCSSIRSTSTSPGVLPTALSTATDSPTSSVVPVRVKPVEGGACGASAVEARRADNDDLIGGSEDAASRRFENPGTRVEADEVVVALEKVDRSVELLLTDRLRDPRIVIRRDDFEPARRLRGVAADIGVPLDPAGVGEERREVRGRLSPDAMSERSGVGIAVDRQ